MLTISVSFRGTDWNKPHFFSPSYGIRALLFSGKEAGTEGMIERHAHCAPGYLLPQQLKAFLHAPPLGVTVKVDILGIPVGYSWHGICIKL